MDNAPDIVDIGCGVQGLNIAAAFRWNPLVFLAGVAFVAWVVYGFYMFISGKNIRVILTRKESLLLGVALAVLFLLNWLYLVVYKI